MPKDEYEAYAGPVYRALMIGKRAAQIVELLTEMQGHIGCRATMARKRQAARRLCALDVRILEQR